MKKLLILFTTLILTVSLALPVFADEETTATPQTETTVTAGEEQAPQTETTAAAGEEQAVSPAAGSTESETEELIAVPYARDEYVWANPETGYEARVQDTLDLLTDDEKSQLLEQMKELTTYGHVIFHTGEESFPDADDYAATIFEEIYGKYSSGSIFLIDMNHRVIQLHNWGDMREKVTDGHALSITDNVFQYAKAGDYYKCASEVFAQEIMLINGEAIAQPMKIISNILFALFFAFLILYIILRIFHKVELSSGGKLIQDAAVTCNVKDVNVTDGGSTKTYSPGSGGGGGSSGSSGGSFGGGFGGGGGFSGGGGFGGGGHTGGGGGHSF